MLEVFLDRCRPIFTESATNPQEYCTLTKTRALATPPLCLLSPLRPVTCPLPLSLLPVSNRAVASLPRASLGCSSRGWGQPSGDPVSKAGGGNRKGGRGGWWEVQQLQDGHAHAAAPCEHAGSCDPLVAARVVLFNGVETGAAIVTSHRI